MNDNVKVHWKYGSGYEGGTSLVFCPKHLAEYEQDWTYKSMLKMRAEMITVPVPDGGACEDCARAAAGWIARALQVIGIAGIAAIVAYFVARYMR